MLKGKSLVAMDPNYLMKRSKSLYCLSELSFILRRRVTLMGQVRKIHDAGLAMMKAELLNIIRKDRDTFILYCFDDVASTVHDCEWKGNKFPVSRYRDASGPDRDPAFIRNCGQLLANGSNMDFWECVNS